MAASALLKLLKPSFYAKEYAAFIVRLRKDVAAGSGAPFFKAIALVGITGYTMEYTMVGRYHVMERQAIVKEAMKNHHH